jgi:ATP-binding cassette subfamily B protein
MTTDRKPRLGSLRGGNMSGSTGPGGPKSPGPNTIISTEGKPPGERGDDSPPKVRETIRLMFSAGRLVWAAGRKEFLILLGADLAMGFGMLVLIVQVRNVVTGLVSSNGGAKTSAIVLNVIVFLITNLAILVAQAIVTNRRLLLTERTGIHVCNRIITVACLAELNDFDNSEFHDRLQRAAASAQTRPAQMVNSIAQLGQQIFSLASIWIAMLTIQPWIALCLVVVVVPVWIGGTHGGERYFQFVRHTSSVDRSRNYLFTLLTWRDPAKEIRAFNLADHLALRWRTIMTDRLDQMRSALYKRFRASLISSIGSNVVLGIAAISLIMLNRSGVLSLAQTAMVAGVLLLFAQKLLEVVTATNDFFEAAPLVRDLDEFLALEPQLVRERSGVPFEGAFDTIEVDDITFTYRTADRPALDHVSLNIRAGEVIALVGENGSGKTTLAKLLAGLYPAQAGHIRVDGTDLRDIDDRSWRDAVAVLFQDFVRYALPAEENIRINRESTLEEVRTAARAAGADDFLAGLPDGYDTILGPQFGKGVDLSLGQWQRVALARAFFRNAPLVILDEPSASLDARAERSLFESVRELYQGRTVLLISHRFSTVRTADRIIVLRDGEIVEQGSHAALMAEQGLYAELFTIQASGFIEADIEELDDSAVLIPDASKND